MKRKSIGDIEQWIYLDVFLGFGIDELIALEVESTPGYFDFLIRYRIDGR
jgi:hypothetical protein